MGASQDPTEPIREQASQYPAVDEGTACTQSSFKAGKRAFLYIGEQGGRYKAMFKLQRSLPEATELAEKTPDRFEVGSTAWVTARFTAEKPMPKRLWQKWLRESYELAVGKGSSKPVATKRKTPKKPAAKKRPATKQARKQKKKK